MEKYVKIFVAASIFLALIAQLSEFRGDIINVLTPTANLAAFIGLLYVSIYSKKLYPKFFPASSSSPLHSSSHSLVTLPGPSSSPS